MNEKPTSGAADGAWDALAWIAPELDRLDRDGLRRGRRTIESLPGGRCRVDGALVWNFAGNDYLGLATHPDVIAAGRDALLKSGGGARASALVTGRTVHHSALEAAIARWKNTEAALLFPTGYAANAGTIPALAGEEDVLFCDRLNHASLVDGCRLSKARFRVFSHTNLDLLNRELMKAKGARRRVILTDSVFSMDGDLAPLAAIHALAVEHRALVIVDEAHATGVYGPAGTGIVPALGLEHAGFVCIGTLSKALGSQGGFVAGSGKLIDWLWNHARTQMYSTALAPASVAAAEAAVRILEHDAGPMAGLRDKVHRLRSELRRSDLAVLGDADCPIVPVVLGDSDRTMRVARLVEERGFLVGAIRPPTVPQGTGRLRITVSAGHPDDALREMAAVLKQAIADADRKV